MPHLQRELPVHRHRLIPQQIAEGPVVQHLRHQQLRPRVEHRPKHREDVRVSQLAQHQDLPQEIPATQGLQLRAGRSEQRFDDERGAPPCAQPTVQL